MNGPRNFGCAVAGCTNPHRARGFCKTHYGRLARTGSPFVDGRTVRKPAAEPAAPIVRRRSDPAVASALAAGGTLTIQQYRQIRSM